MKGGRKPMIEVNTVEYGGINHEGDKATIEVVFFDSIAETMGNKFVSAMYDAEKKQILITALDKTSDDLLKLLITKNRAPLILDMLTGTQAEIIKATKSNDHHLLRRVTYANMEDGVVAGLILDATCYFHNWELIIFRNNREARLPAALTGWLLDVLTNRMEIAPIEKKFETVRFIDNLLKVPEPPAKGSNTVVETNPSVTMVDEEDVEDFKVVRFPKGIVRLTKPPLDAGYHKVNEKYYKVEDNNGTKVTDVTDVTHDVKTAEAGKIYVQGDVVYTLEEDKIITSPLHIISDGNYPTSSLRGYYKFTTVQPVLTYGEPEINITLGTLYHTTALGKMKSFVPGAISPASEAADKLFTTGEKAFMLNETGFDESGFHCVESGELPSTYTENDYFLFPGEPGSYTRGEGVTYKFGTVDNGDADMPEQGVIYRIKGGDVPKMERTSLIQVELTSMVKVFYNDKKTFHLTNTSQITMDIVVIEDGFYPFRPKKSTPYRFEKIQPKLRKKMASIKLDRIYFGSGLNPKLIEEANVEEVTEKPAVVDSVSVDGLYVAKSALITSETEPDPTVPVLVKDTLFTNETNKDLTFLNDNEKVTLTSDEYEIADEIPKFCQGGFEMPTDDTLYILNMNDNGKVKGTAWLFNKETFEYEQVEI